jgi:hypothetical protein
VIQDDESHERLSGLRFADHPLRHLHHLAVCTRCLAEDARPYLRLPWMIGWMAVCPRHQTRLLTLAPQPHRADDPAVAEPMVGMGERRLLSGHRSVSAAPQSEGKHPRWCCEQPSPPRTSEAGLEPG